MPNRRIVRMGPIAEILLIVVMVTLVAFAIYEIAGALLLRFRQTSSPAVTPSRKTDRTDTPGRHPGRCATERFDSRACLNGWTMRPEAPRFALWARGPESATLIHLSANGARNRPAPEPMDPACAGMTAYAELAPRKHVLAKAEAGIHRFRLPGIIQS